MASKAKNTVPTLSKKKTATKTKKAPVHGSKSVAVSQVSRRDGTGHLNATYEADLRERSLASAEDHTVDRAFLRRGKTRPAPLADELGREAVMTMTSAEDQSDQLQDVELDLGEELGGPFLPPAAQRGDADAT